MKNVDPKAIAAVAFLVIAFGILLVTAIKTNSTDDQHQLFPADSAQVAPSFTLPNAATGLPIILGNETAKGPVVLDFWAAYCTACPPEMQRLQEYSEKYKGKISFIGINADDKPAAITAYLTSNHIRFPTVIDLSGRSTDDYEIHGLPTAVFIDGNGRVRYMTVGYDSAMDDYVPGVLEQLVKAQ